MSSSIDELLDMVDKWKFKLHAKLKKMTPKQRAAFWKTAHKDAIARGLGVEPPALLTRPKPKRRPRATG